MLLVFLSSVVPLQDAAAEVIQLLKDSTTKLTIENIAALPEGAFNQYSDIFTDGYSEAVYWVKIPIPAPVGRQRLGLHISTNALTKVDVFILNSSSNWDAVDVNSEFAGGLIESAINDSIASEIKGHESLPMPLYARISSKNLLKFSYAFVKSSQTQKIARVTIWIEGFYYGAILLILSLAISVALFVKDKRYQAYSIYVGCSALMYSAINGYIIDPSLNFINVYLFPSLHFLVTLFAVNFAKHYLNLKAGHPKLLWFSKVLMGTCLLALAVTALDPGLGLRMLPYFGMILAGGILSIAVSVARKGAKEGRYFVAAWLVLLTSGIAYSLDMLGLIGNLGKFPALAMQFGSLLEMVIFIISFGLIYRTARETLEIQTRELIDSSRMVAIGNMAAGIAHEINNPLSIIRACGSNLKYLLERNAPLAVDQAMETVETLLETVKRIADLISAVLLISRRETTTDLEALSVDQALSSVLTLCANNMENYNIRLIIAAEDSYCRIICSRVLVAQVLSNIVINAIDEIKNQSEPRWIRIETERVEGRLKIAVANSGPKMSEVAIANAFDPFYTTKSVGQGLGLGLSIARQMTEAQRGKIYIDGNAVNTKFVVDFEIASNNWLPNQNA